MQNATIYTRDDLLDAARGLPLDRIELTHVARAPVGDRRKLEMFLDVNGQVKELTDAGEPHYPPLPRLNMRCD